MNNMVESENGCKWRLQGGPRRGQDCGKGDGRLCKTHKKMCLFGRHGEYRLRKAINQVFGGEPPAWTTQHEFRFVLQWLSKELEDAYKPFTRWERDSRGGKGVEVLPSVESVKEVVKQRILVGKKIIEISRTYSVVQKLLPSVLLYPAQPPFTFTPVDRRWGGHRMIKGQQAADIYEALFDYYYSCLHSCRAFFEVGESDKNEFETIMVEFDVSDDRIPICCTSETPSDISISSRKQISDGWEIRQQNKEVAWSMWKEDFPLLLSQSEFYKDIFTVDWSLVRADVRERIAEYEQFLRQPEPSLLRDVSRERYRQGE